MLAKIRDKILAEPFSNYRRYTRIITTDFFGFPGYFSTSLSLKFQENTGKHACYFGWYSSLFLVVIAQLSTREASATMNVGLWSRIMVREGKARKECEERELFLGTLFSLDQLDEQENKGEEEIEPHPC